MEQSVDIETVNKHFKTVPNQAAPPTKLQEALKITPEHFKEAFNNFWLNNGVRYYDTFQTGKIIASSRQVTDIETILSDIANIIEESIKAANTKCNKTTENLDYHFKLLYASLKVIAKDLELVNTGKDKQSIDYFELLAMLSGYIAEKVYGGQN